MAPSTNWKATAISHNQPAPSVITDVTWCPRIQICHRLQILQCLFKIWQRWPRWASSLLGVLITVCAPVRASVFCSNVPHILMIAHPPSAWLVFHLPTKPVKHIRCRAMQIRENLDFKPVKWARWCPFLRRPLWLRVILSPNEISTIALFNSFTETQCVV